jgi:hypothetical protein
VAGLRLGGIPLANWRESQSKEAVLPPRQEVE